MAVGADASASGPVTQNHAAITCDAPSTEPALYDERGNWKVVFGENCPVYKDPPPLPAIGTYRVFRVLRSATVHSRPEPESEKLGEKRKGEILRVREVLGLWACLAPETEAEVCGSFEGWVLLEDGEVPFFEEVADPEEAEKLYTEGLIRRVSAVGDHIAARLRERTARALRYLGVGRVPPGKKDALPDGTRCLNSFWGLEVRYVRLAPKQEYWPQGCIDLHPIEEARSGHWRVFAARPFEENELVEVCPLCEVDLQEAIHSMPLRMNIIETLMAQQGVGSTKAHSLRCTIPIGYGMLYQQSVDPPDVNSSWEPSTKYNVRMLPVGDHLYIYAARRILAEEELILKFQRNFRDEDGGTVDFTGYTPYWSRGRHPETYEKVLSSWCGELHNDGRQMLPGQVKFGKSKLHGRGVFADTSFKAGEIVEICPCLLLDRNGYRAANELAFRLPAVQVTNGEQTIIKRDEMHVLPLGYGSMHNHLSRGGGQNVDVLFDDTTQSMVVVAKPAIGEEHIPKNSELCVDYGEDFWHGDQRRKKRQELRMRATQQQ